MSFSGQAVASLNTAHPSPAQMTRPAAARTAGGEGLSALETLGSVCRFRRGETIFGEGEELQSSYRIVSGAVRLSRITEDGRRQIVEFRTAGDFIGFEWDDHCALSAEAVRDVTAIRYVKTRVDRLIEQRPDVRDHVVALIREELRTAHEHLITLGCPGARERVATFLLQLAYRSKAGDGDVIDMELGRQDIADYLGLTLETISRTLSEFKRLGIISLPKRRQIVIRSRVRLRAQAAPIN
jgi:CRP/FNR family nitrogen fixation transcriptional regulator